MRVLLASALLLPALALAQGEPRLRLKNHEPIFAGYTWDSDDDPFLDVTLSLQHPILARQLGEGRRFGLLPYFAFTTRFGQYIGERESSPVIAKRFNPKLFVRYGLSPFPESGDSPDAYLDFEYAHESNGQSVDSPASFQSTAQTLGNTEYAKDYISRGWDYLGVTGKWSWKPEPEVLRFYLSRKWYCGCLLQKHIEQLYAFEEPREIRSIKQVSGWRAILTFDSNNEKALIDRVALILDTGTRDPFKYVTGRIELGIPAVKNFTGIPLVFWARTGYLSDLAQYYAKVTSYGLAFELWTLDR